MPIGHLTDAVIPVIVHEQNPQVLDASAQADTARSLLSQDFSIVVPDAGAGDPGPWALSPQIVADMLSFREVTNS